VHGRFAGIPIVVDVVNTVNATRAMRRLMDSRLGVHPDAWMPQMAPQRFRWGGVEQPRPEVKDGQRTPGKVAIYATCYVNYNEPGIGNDLVKVLDHNRIPWEIVEKERCCGMPKLELGDLEAVERAKEANIPVLARYAREGWAIVTPVPSCTLMYKQELPLMFPDDADVQLVKEAMFDPFEYLVARHKDGLLRPTSRRRWARSATTSPATAGCRTSGRRPKSCSSSSGRRWTSS
jgi:glycerol-3-phosphate dehydrogenase subunit C